jgi:hypothetical protein
MLDMIGNEINVGDFVLFPDGNPRYGGLKLTLGKVTKMTPKRISLMTTSLVYDDKPCKGTTKSGHKVLRCTNSFVRGWESSQKLVKETECQF